MAARGKFQLANSNEFSAAHIWNIAGYGPEACHEGSYIDQVIGKNTTSQQFVVPSSVWPYSKTDPEASLGQIPDKSVLDANGVAYIEESSPIDPSSVSEIKSAIVSHAPAVISVPVYWDTGWKTDGQIHSPPPGDELGGYHAIAILEYDDTLQQFRFINSWGPNWGKSGFGTLSYEFVQKYSSGGRAIKSLKYNPANPKPGVQAYMCAVRADAGYLYAVDGGAATKDPSGCSWDAGCAALAYPQTGQDFQSNGFFLCVRPDLITKRFYVGNVVNNVGYYYEFQNGAPLSMSMASWNYCKTGSLIGTFFDQNGFWVCLEQ